MLLDGKSAVITGAGSGVGRASALRFAEEGARSSSPTSTSTAPRRRCASSKARAAPPSPIACDVVEGGRRRVDAIAAAVDQFGRLDIMFNNVGIPTPRPGLIFEEHTSEDFDRLFAINFRGVFLGCKHAVIQFKEQGDGGVILNTGSVAGLVGWGGSVYGATKGAVHQLTRAVAIEGAPFGIRCNAICPAGMPYTNFMAAGGMTVVRRGQEQMASGRRRDASARPADHRRGLRRGGGVPRVRRGDERHRRAAAGRRRVRRAMTATGDAQVLDREELRRAVRPAQQLQSRDSAVPTPTTRTRSGTRCASRRRCTRASCTSSPAIPVTAYFHGLPYPDRPHFSAFSFEACDAAYRNPEVFASAPAEEPDRDPRIRGAEQHAVDGRRRSTGATARSCSRRSCRPRRSGGSATGSSRPSTC